MVSVSFASLAPRAASAPAKDSSALRLESLLAELPVQPSPRALSALRTPAEILGMSREPDVGAALRQSLMPAPDRPAAAKEPASAPDLPVAPLSGEAFAALSKNPVSVLNEFAQTRGLTCTFEVIGSGGPAHRLRLEMAAKVGGRLFPAVMVTSKKDGRREAADR